MDDFLHLPVCVPSLLALLLCCRYLRSQGHHRESKWQRRESHRVLYWPEGWPAPNYIDPPTRGSPALFIFTAAVTTVVVALRIYSRFCLTRSPGIDDIFLGAGFVSLSDPYVFFSDKTGAFYRSDVRVLQEPHDLGMEQASLGCSYHQS